MDFINLIAYDFHGTWESPKITKPAAPLYPKPDDDRSDKEYTVEYGVDYWIKKGAERNKIVSLFMNKDNINVCIFIS